MLISVGLSEKILYANVGVQYFFLRYGYTFCNLLFMNVICAYSLFF